MSTANLRPGRLILKPFIYGSLISIIALLIKEATLTETIRYTSNWTAFLVLFILCWGAFAYFKLHNASLISIKQLFASSLIFGIGAGAVLGFSCYLTMTVFEPDYLERALDASYKSWAARGYSKDAVADQLELTDSFQNPLKNSAMVAVFYLLLTAALSFIIGFLSRKDVCLVPPPDDLKRA